MALSNSMILRGAPRRICFAVRMANQRSTKFNQEIEVAVNRR